jgi:hypothetical protein
MDVTELVDKGKIRCDNIISITLILGIVILLLFFRLLTYMSLMIFPFFSLFLHGIDYIYRLATKKYKTVRTRVFRLMLGIFYIVLSSFVIWLVFSHPQVTASYIVYFLSIFMVFIGLAGILKGYMIEVYSLFYRKANIIVGFTTMIIIILALFFVESFFFLSLTSLIALLVLNGFMRSGLYLSEFGLSLRNLKNLKYVFYIMDNFIILNLEEDYKR